jgi:hypothetical protein
VVETVGSGGGGGSGSGAVVVGKGGGGSSARAWSEAMPANAAVAEQASAQLSARRFICV